jgi:hypothetical protein
MLTKASTGQLSAIADPHVANQLLQTQILKIFYSSTMVVDL